MMNFDCVRKENIKEHDPNWPQILDRPYRILLIGGAESGNTDGLFNLISLQPDIDKVYLDTKDPYEVKYQLLTKKWKKV